ncbi:hypothetical protein LCER1_G006404, partial [Lachnellula cervina]
VRANWRKLLRQRNSKPLSALLTTKNQENTVNMPSNRKKFRKMMHIFDEKMHHSNFLYMREHQAEVKAKKLAQDNDRLLDLLLDINDSAQLAADKRFDLSASTPALSAVPPLVSDDDLALLSTLKSPEGHRLAEEIQVMIKDKETAQRHSIQTGPKPPRALAQLMATVPHLTTASSNVSSDLLSSLETPEGHEAPFSYLTPDQLDEYIEEIDAQIGNGPPVSRKKEQPDVMLRNPNSAYNWLRKHRPDCFLQDGEGIEKAHGKPGALRGAGKRASLPVPSKPDALEFVEEDGLGYDASLAGPGTGGKGKRKREDGDDGTYHPKSGRVDESGAKVKKPRPPRKKKSEGSDEVASSKGSRKSKKARVSSSGIPEEPSELAPA